MKCQERTTLHSHFLLTEMIWNRYLKEILARIPLKFYGGYYTVARRYEFYVLVARTISHSVAALTRCSRHSNIKFVSSRHRVMFFFQYYINILMTAFWWFSEDFRSLSENFRRFSKIVPKVRRTFPNIFRKFSEMSEDCRRLARKTRGCFDDTPTNLSTI